MGWWWRRRARREQPWWDRSPAPSRRPPEFPERRQARQRQVDDTLWLALQNELGMGVEFDTDDAWAAVLPYTRGQLRRPSRQEVEASLLRMVARDRLDVRLGEAGWIYSICTDWWR